MTRYDLTSNHTSGSLEALTQAVWRLSHAVFGLDERMEYLEFGGMIRWDIIGSNFEGVNDNA